MIFKLTSGGVKENLVLTAILHEWRRRNPEDKILLETSMPELFADNADVTEIGSWSENSVIDFDILCLSEFDMHIMDLYALATFGDNRLLSRRMITGRLIKPQNGTDVLLGRRVHEEHPDLIQQVRKSHSVSVVDYVSYDIDVTLSRIHSSGVFVGADEDITWLAMSTDIPIVMLAGPHQSKNIRPFREGVVFETIAVKCEFARECLKKSSSMFANVYHPWCRNENMLVCETGVCSSDILVSIDRVIRKDIHA